MMQHSLCRCVVGNVWHPYHTQQFSNVSECMRSFPVGATAPAPTAAAVPLLPRNPHTVTHLHTSKRSSNDPHWVHVQYPCGHNDASATHSSNGSVLYCQEHPTQSHTYTSNFQTIFKCPWVHAQWRNGSTNTTTTTHGSGGSSTAKNTPHSHTPTHIQIPNNLQMPLGARAVAQRQHQQHQPRLR